MWDDLAHLIALTIDRSDWIISEIFRGKRPYSPVPFLNGELSYMNISQEKPHGLALSILGTKFAMCTVVCGINSVHCNLM